ncbi:MAG: TraE/TraK family type IV conjugative transfer system protein [Pseudomonadota bacterium]
MELKIATQNHEVIKKQKNLFLGFSILLLVISCALSLKIASIDEKVIMVPALRQTISVSGSEVSAGYLEEMSALVFLPGLLDLSADNVTYKRGLILKYTAQSSKEYMKAIAAYFADAKDKYTKFDLSTHFTAKNMEIDPNDLVVVANGILTSIHGKRGHEAKSVSYRISYEFNGGQLRLKEFNQVIDEKELEKLEKERVQKAAEEAEILKKSTKEANL